MKTTKKVSSIKYQVSRGIMYVLLFTFHFSLSTFNCFSQCASYIKVDGNMILASATATDPIAIVLPIWLEAGQTLAADQNVYSISVLEFTINGTSLEFSRTLKVTTIQTVPSSKTWKVESVLKYGNFAVGEWYQGGIVTYITGCGSSQSGLVAAQSDQSGSAAWATGCAGATGLVGASGIVVGTGLANTTAILAGCGTAGIAAEICNNLVLNGYSDWYLPSKDELSQMYMLKTVVGGFAANYYWSSSEDNAGHAWLQHFGVGNQYNDGKPATYYVRCVRAF